MNNTLEPEIQTLIDDYQQNMERMHQRFQETLFNSAVNAAVDAWKLPDKGLNKKLRIPYRNKVFIPIRLLFRFGIEIMNLLIGEKNELPRKMVIDSHFVEQAAHEEPMARFLYQNTEITQDERS